MEQLADSVDSLRTSTGAEATLQLRSLLLSHTSLAKLFYQQFIIGTFAGFGAYVSTNGFRYRTEGSSSSSISLQDSESLPGPRSCPYLPLSIHVSLVSNISFGSR